MTNPEPQEIKGFVAVVEAKGVIISSTFRDTHIKTAAETLNMHYAVQCTIRPATLTLDTEKNDG